MRCNGSMALILAAAMLGGCGGTVNGSVEASAVGASTVNGSIHVAAGQHSGSLNTVNGGVHVDDHAVVGAAQTVNGSIDLGADASAESLQTVNGGISLAAGAHVRGEVAAVNGALRLAQGADVSGPARNVNGAIRLASAHVGGGLRTVNGDISVEGASRVEGGVVVQKPGSGWLNWRIGPPPKVVIGPGAVVSGELRFERKVQLYVSDQATVGPIVGATAVRFSGSQPPA